MRKHRREVREGALEPMVRASLPHLHRRTSALGRVLQTSTPAHGGEDCSGEGRPRRRLRYMSLHNYGTRYYSTMQSLYIRLPMSCELAGGVFGVSTMYVILIFVYILVYNFNQAKQKLQQYNMTGARLQTIRIM